MRIAPLLALSVLVLPVSVQAQDDVFADQGAEGLARAAEAMSDPATQAQVSAVAGSLMGALMDMPVGSLLQAAEGMTGRSSDIDPDTTVAELAGPDAEMRGEELAERVPQMMQTLAAFTYARDGVLPQLRDALADAARTAGENAVRDIDRN